MRSGLRVTGTPFWRANGASAERSFTLTVNNVPPLVNAGPDQEKVALDEVSFAGSFTDPSSPDHTFEWDFGDGSPKAIGTLTPEHVYAEHGGYTVTLTVSDSHGASASDTLTVSVISAWGCWAGFRHSQQSCGDPTL